jgi:phage virion morphogenesis protein
MAGAAIVIDHKFNDRKVIAAFKRLIDIGSNPDDVLYDILGHLELSHQERWEKQEAPDGTPWAPLSETTQKLKPKNNDLILVLEGYLMQLHGDISGGVLEFGTDKPYGAMMQFGGITSPNSMIPGVEIPARPYLGISTDDESNILGIVQEHLNAAMQG